MLFNKILVAVDGSESSVKCIDMACELQKLTNAELVFLCVYRHHGSVEASLSSAPLSAGTPAEAMKEYATSVINDAKQRAKDNGAEEMRGFIKSGQPARTIVKFAKDNDFDVIVLGSRGHGDMDGFLLGSVSHKVTALSHCPCLTVK